MSIYAKLETGHTDGLQLLLRFDERGIKELHKALNRAANLVEGVSKDIFELTLEVDKVIERMERRDEAAAAKHIG